MSYRVEFLGIAEEELEDAVQWYANQKDNLSASFVSAIDILLSYVIENPFLFPIVHNEMRKATLRSFPYSIIYEVHNPDVILVIAIMHQKRNPDRFIDR